ncbi:CCA tRNA nucleotidyltransferase [Asticcacaulis benevestitus]|uniref:CCA tRNA nucleotidyltransferase n=1 Tax=Asticcacaulis benevestitus TaxID=347481 RepID=UPI00039A8B6F|nr:CCA tRNA nucleotidyltransferase [Asticcacaulis benevestitus]
MTTIPLSDAMMSTATRAVFAALEARGGKGCVRFVGGCVRNALMGKPISDLDLSTQLTPDETEAALEAAGIRSVPTGKAFGTITAVVDGRPLAGAPETYEITSLREDVETDGRRAVVAYTTDWNKDALRRDFYLNALYADIDGQVFDPTGQGIADAQGARVRFIGEAEQRIREDYLRILRFFRFTAGYAKAIDEASLAACVALKDGIDGLSGERIQQELLKTLKLSDPMPAFAAMAVNGFMPLVVPGWSGADLAELVVMKGLSDEPERRLIALFDCGIGLKAEDLQAVQARLKMSQRLYNRLLDAGQVADLLAGPQETPFARLMYLHGRQATEDALYLVAAHLNKDPAAVDYVMAMLQGLEIPVFPLKGADLIKRGYSAGPELGKALKQIETEWVNHDFSQSVIDRALDATAK